jgi:hypothetical protein
MPDDSGGNGTAATARGTIVAIGVAGVFCFSAIVVSAYLILRHFKHWVEPAAQACVVRILLMVPVYVLSSWLSLLLAQHTLYFNLARDCYEAYVLYQFFALLVHYFDAAQGADMGASGRGDTATGDYLERLPARYHPFPCCCWPPIRPGARFLLTTKRCILQYVLVKPMAALLAATLQLAGLYEEGSTRLDRAYVWLTLLVNVSVSLSLYYLVIFYDTIARVIEDEQPHVLYKLITIKLLLFFVFWQTLAIDALYYFKVVPAFLSISGGHDILNNALVCAEMLVLALVNLWVYPYAGYRDGTNTLDQCFANCWERVAKQRDLLEDTREVFLF